MCRNIKTLFNFDPPATDDGREIWERNGPRTDSDGNLISLASRRKSS